MQAKDLAMLDFRLDNMLVYLHGASRALPISYRHSVTEKLINGFRIEFCYGFSTEYFETDRLWPYFLKAAFICGLINAESM